MKLLIDMNLSPDWNEVFEEVGWESLHWSSVGDSRAPDRELMEWARAGGWTVFAHDLDFGAILAATGAVAPSVVQLRCEDIRPTTMGQIVTNGIQACRDSLSAGAIVTIDPRRMRVTLLPLKNA